VTNDGSLDVPSAQTSQQGKGEWGKPSTLENKTIASTPVCLPTIHLSIMNRDDSNDDMGGADIGNQDGIGDQDGIGIDDIDTSIDDIEGDAMGGDSSGDDSSSDDSSSGDDSSSDDSNDDDGLMIRDEVGPRGRFVADLTQHSAIRVDMTGPIFCLSDRRVGRLLQQRPISMSSIVIMSEGPLLRDPGLYDAFAPLPQSARRAGSAIANVFMMTAPQAGGLIERLELSLSDGAVDATGGYWQARRVNRRRRRRRAVVDAFWDGLATAAASSEGVSSLRCLDLRCFGGSPGPWRRFVERFGPNIAELEIDARFVVSPTDEIMEEEVSRSLRLSSSSTTSFSVLDTLRITSNCLPGCARTVRSVLGAVPTASSLKNVHLSLLLEEGAQGGPVLAAPLPQQPDPTLVVEELRGVSDAATLCRSLRTLSVMVQGWDGATLPALRDVVSRSPANVSLRVDCNSASAPFLCAGIEDPTSLFTDLTVALSSAQLIDCVASMASVLHSVERTTRLTRFAGHIYVDRDDWVDPATFANVGVSLSELLRRDSSALKSLICDLASVVTSYRHAAAVSRQDLLEWDFAPLFNGARHNAAAIVPRGPVGRGQLPLERDVGPIFNRDRHPAFAIVSRAVEGLRGNRHLLVLDLCTTHQFGGVGGVPVPATVGKEIVGMLQGSNTTLQRIEGLVYESAEHDVLIRHLLLMNRYGRNLAHRGRHSVPVEHWGEVLMRISTFHSNQCIVEMVRHATETRSAESPSVEPEMKLATRSNDQRPPCKKRSRTGAFCILNR
jgi:hypothetical protein